jgi:hypothetical protein
MNQFRVIAAVAITGLVGVLPAAAQGKSGSHGGGTTTHGRPTTTTSGASTSGTTTHGKSADAGTRATDAKAGKKPTTTTTTTTTTAGTTTGTNALATKISNNPNQLARISTMLPQGMTLDQATAGFRNQGQFIAALNASKNQGVPFADLQKAMTVDGLSLGQAVRDLKAAPAPTTTTDGTTSGSTAPTTAPTTTTTTAS